MAIATTYNQNQTVQKKATSVEVANRFIKLAVVRSLTTLSTSELYRRIAADTFPKQIMLGPKSAVWLEAEVIAWCDERIAASRHDVPPQLSSTPL